METKRWWQSFTHWFNLLGVTLMGLVGPLTDTLPSIQPYVGPNFYKYAFITLAVGNMLIRQFKTKTAIGGANVQSASQ